MNYKKIRDTLKKDMLTMTPQEVESWYYELAQNQYKFRPVTFKEFLENPLYLPGANDILYPVWREKLMQIYPPESFLKNPYYLIILCACIGAGKSFLMYLIGAYELYKATCLKDPCKFYGLGDNDIIYWMFHNFKKTGMGDTNWKKFRTLLKSSPYFAKEIDIPNNVTDGGMFTDSLAVEVITTAEDAVSKAILFVGMDEYNEKKTLSTNNTNIYKALDRRMESRFMDSSGFIPYKFVVASSPKDESDQLSEVIEESRKVAEHNLKGNKKALITEDIPAWLTSGSKIEYSGEKFRFYLGDEGSDAKIIDNPLEAQSLDLDKVKFIPVEYESSFRLDPEGSIRDILGMRTGLSGKLYPNKKLIDDIFVRQNLWDVDTLKVPFNIGYEEGIQLLLNHINTKMLAFPDQPRAIHCDIALSGDRLGLSSCYIIPFDVFTREKSEFTSIFKNNLYISDFSIGIESASGQDIPLDVIAGFIDQLERLNYPIGIVTYDGFQSASISQPLDRFKIPNEYLSVDRTKEPYITHKRAVINGRYIGVNNDVMKEEFKDIRNFPQKIDHVTNGSKDISDSAVGSFWSCFINENILLSSRKVRNALSNSGGKTNSMKTLLQNSGYKVR